MIKIEVLFPEICNLYGDLFNIKYLNKCIKESEVINTSINQTPKFVEDNDIDMIYMAPMTEKTQEIVIEKLRPYTQRIKELIDNKKLFLVTGNALEIFGKYIENEDGSKIEGLGIFDIYAKRDMMHRFNSLFLGKFEDLKIVGFKAQFSMCYGENSDKYLFESIKGPGLNKESKYEGIKVNNFIGTYLLGPILLLNPLFTKYILKLLNQDEKLEFEEEAMDAYETRLKEFENPKTKY